MKAMSLFSNIGVAEALLKDINIDVCVANELIERRAKLYSQIYPHTNMICGDINDVAIYESLVSEAINNKCDIVMATPPCQGMSTAGCQDKNDTRNSLICPVVRMVREIMPKYVFIENVPLFYNTKIYIDGNNVLIPEYIKYELSKDYVINDYVVDMKDYSVPQTRERAVMLLSRKDLSNIWTLPKKDEKIVTMRDAIGDLPELDPYVYDITDEERNSMFPLFEKRKKIASRISFWHFPPKHVKRQVVAMQHTPTGCTAFDNPVYFPIKVNGEPAKGYHNTYKRQNWDTAAYTVTMDNRKISSQNNVHPGKKYITDDGEELYSDPRALSLYELMIIMSLPKDWPVPRNTSKAFLRSVIGEGIPPLFVKKVFQELV